MSGIIASSLARITWTRSNYFFHQGLLVSSRSRGTVFGACHLSSDVPFLSTSPEENKDKKRRLDVAIVGAPNAGKSQLLNVLTRSNVAAVSRKRHTTRQGGVLGARTVGQTQLVFIDTPGFLRAKTAKQEGLFKDMMDEASKEVQRADYTLIVVDAAKKLTHDFKEALVTLMLQAKYSQGRIEETLENCYEDEEEEEVSLEKFALILNKVDLVNPKHKLLTIATELGTIADECILYNGQENEQDKDKQLSQEDLELLAEASPPIFYISALQNDGVKDILQHLLDRATPSRQWPVAANEVSDATPLERIEEVIREKIYRSTHREVPYAVRQVNRALQKLRHRETGQEAIRVEQDLVVSTKSHKRLLYGKGGMTLKRIKEAAERDLQGMFDCKIMLNLHVKLTKSKHARQLDSQEYGMNDEIIIKK